ncbi:MAG: flagellar basal body rod protein FlgC [Clostridiales bacterium]|nr:flagellar basal body rod protein FlgC [Clostridiales bacterium]
MSFLRALNISGSALTAQRARLDIVSENISNIDTTRTENGGPYRRKVVQFQAVGDKNFKTALGNALLRDGEHRAGHVNHVHLRHRHVLQAGQGGAGVIVSDIIEDESPFKTIYDPTHPDADEYGYVMMPNVELIKEVVDAMSASRSYEANVTAVNAVKLMASKALEVGR